MRSVARKDKSEYVIRNVSQALVLLEQFQGADVELGVTELSRLMMLHKNKIFRLLATLESRNFIEQNHATGGYRLGMKNLELGNAVTRPSMLKEQVRPFLAALAARIDETVYLAVLQNSSVVYLDEVETTRPVRLVTRYGARLPADCTAAGKVLLAALSAKERMRIVASATDLLFRQLYQVAQHGFAREDDELGSGVRSLSVPISRHNRVVGALVVSGPAMRFDDERCNADLLPALRETAAAVTTALEGRM